MAWISWLNLIFLYLLLANYEEKILKEKYGEKTQRYRQQVPFILPLSLSISNRLPTPKSKFKRYTLIIFTYLIIMILAWKILKQFSYAPEP